VLGMDVVLCILELAVKGHEKIAKIE